MNMRVLILGAKGMLGQALVRAFHDAEVFAWDREECDITDRTGVQKKIDCTLLYRSGKKCTIDNRCIIINAAAYNDVDSAEKNIVIANRINGESVGYLAEAAANVGATFVHYSTDYVFDGGKKDGYHEDDTPSPISSYGRSKLLGEKAILSLRGAERRGNPTVYLIRTSRLFGAPGNGKKSFVDLMLERSLGGSTSKYIEVIDEELSSPTYVEDLAQHTREIIEQKKPSGIYHVTNSGACTWYEFAQEIFSAKGGSAFGGRLPMIKPVSSSHFPRPAKRPVYSQLLNTKLQSMRSWQEALRTYLITLQ